MVTEVSSQRCIKGVNLVKVNWGGWWGWNHPRQRDHHVQCGMSAALKESQWVLMIKGYGHMMWDEWIGRWGPDLSLSYSRPTLNNRNSDYPEISLLQLHPLCSTPATQVSNIHWPPGRKLLFETSFDDTTKRNCDHENMKRPSPWPQRVCVLVGD